MPAPVSATDTDTSRSSRVTLTRTEPPAGVTDIEAAAILAFDVPFPHGGVYRFEITIDGRLEATVPITVTQVPAPAGGSGPAGQKLH